MKKNETIGIYGLKTLMQHNVDFDGLRYSPKAGMFYFSGRIPPGLAAQLKDIGFNYPYQIQQDTPNLLTMETDKIKAEVKAAYETDGMQGACSVGDKHNLLYHFCRHCNNETPSIENECGICGQPSETLTIVKAVGTDLDEAIECYGDEYREYWKAMQGDKDPLYFAELNHGGFYLIMNNLEFEEASLAAIYKHLQDCMP